MAQVKKPADATAVKVYFAEPHCPWQRPTNERLKGDIANTSPKEPISPTSSSKKSPSQQTNSTTEPAASSTDTHPVKYSNNK